MKGLWEGWWARAAVRAGGPIAAGLLLISAAAACSDDATGPGGSSPDALAGPTWELVSIRRGVTSSRPVQGHAPAVGFTTEPSPNVAGFRTFGGTGGCNFMGGAWRSGGPGALEIRQIVATEMACLTAGVMEYEVRFFTALAASGGFRVDGDELALFFDGGVLIFRRSD